MAASKAISLKIDRKIRLFLPDFSDFKRRFAPETGIPE